METERRRGIQQAYNEAHGIVPKTIVKEMCIRDRRRAVTKRKHLPRGLPAQRAKPCTGKPPDGVA